MKPPISHVPFIVPDRGSPSVTSSTFVKLKHLLVGAFSAKVCPNRLAITSLTRAATEQSVA